MKRIAIALVASVALSATSVWAADMAVKMPPPASAGAGQFWAEVDYLAWTVKGDRLPALLTTNSLGAGPTLGAPGTSVLFGDSSVNDRWRSGGRLQAGYWFDASHRTGVEGSFFDLQNVSTGLNAASGGTPILGQPFFNALISFQDARLIAFPGVSTGSFSANDTSRLLGGSLLYRQEIAKSTIGDFSALVGYRYLYASDAVSVSTNVVSLIFPLTIGTGDSFKATNDFNGVEIGLVDEAKSGAWRLEARGTLSLGANYNRADINGSTTITAGGVTTPFTGGFYAVSSNIGTYTQVHFAAVPELNLKVGYQLAPQWQLIAGYDLLYWTGVQRAGNLIDTTVNPNLSPPPLGGGPQRPRATFNTTDLLAQGFNFGFRYGY
jgi:Putative beta barrel porin-7 (BBP7)